MRSMILATALALLAPVALAQSYPPQYKVTPGYPSGSMNDDSSHASHMMQPDPNNCGTPDEPKPCPPMPHRALQTYPANK